MKKILRYYFKRPKGLEREVERNTHALIFLTAFMIGFIFSKYIDIAYWAGAVIVLFPTLLYRQYKNIIELEKRD